MFVNMRFCVQTLFGILWSFALMFDKAVAAVGSGKSAKSGVIGKSGASVVVGKSGESGKRGESKSMSG